MDDTEEDHVLTSDDDADDQTIERIAQGFPLASVLRRERDTHGAITRAEKRQALSRCKQADMYMSSIYRTYEQLCEKISAAGGEIPESIDQDIHEQVFKPALENLVLKRRWKDVQSVERIAEDDREAQEEFELSGWRIGPRRLKQSQM